MVCSFDLVVLTLHREGGKYRRFIGGKILTIAMLSFRVYLHTAQEQELGVLQKGELDQRYLEKYINPKA